MNLFLMKTFALLAALMIIPPVMAQERSHKSPIELRLERDEFPPRLSVSVTNASTAQIGLWKSSNSWGWASLEFHFKERASGKVWIIRRKQIDWTVNFPTWHVIESGKLEKIAVNIQDGTWEIPRGFEDREGRYQIQCILEIKQTPEAKTHGIFVGKVESDWD